MSSKLKKLVEQWQRQLTNRDCGVAAKKTWAQIKQIATLQEQVEILEQEFKVK